MDLSQIEQLYHKHFNTTYRTAYLVTRDHQLAEDAAQEAFLKAFSNLHKLRDIRKFGPWVCTIATNYAIDLLRKNKKLIFSDNTETHSDHNIDNSPHKSWERKEISYEIRDALQLLEVDEREVMVLKYYNELSIKEIASLTNTPQGTIKSRLFRARKKIGSFLQPETGKKRLYKKLPSKF
ncbi:MAG: RNA polymerase sigma factor [Dethiobacteria bacterium]